MTSKELYEKTCKVIGSCQTKEQLKVATKYTSLALIRNPNSRDAMDYYWLLGYMSAIVELVENSTDTIIHKIVKAKPVQRVLR